MSCWNNTSCRRICCSPIKADRVRPTSVCSLLLRWQLVDNLLPRGSVPWSNRCYPTPRPTSVPTVPPVLYSIPREFCSGACSSSTRTGPSKCLSFFTSHVTIGHWWNSAPYGGVGQNPSFSKTRISTRWRTVYTRCPFQPAMLEGPVQRRR